MFLGPHGVQRALLDNNATRPQPVGDQPAAGSAQQLGDEPGTSPSAALQGPGTESQGRSRDDVQAAVSPGAILSSKPTSLAPEESGPTRQDPVAGGLPGRARDTGTAWAERPLSLIHI